MDENYEMLFQCIRARCRQQRWHGPDISNPFQLVEEMRKTNIPRQMGSFVFTTHSTSFWYDRNGKQYAINVDTDLDSFPLQEEFEYPPATEEQVAITQAALGFSLPPLLRTLYTNVANGGFGPGYGLERIGYSPTNEEQDSTEKPIDLTTYASKYAASLARLYPFAGQKMNGRVPFTQILLRKEKRDDQSAKGDYTSIETV